MIKLYLQSQHDLLDPLQHQPLRYRLRLIVNDNATVGVGAGQVSRVDSVDIALSKADNNDGAILLSDAFFPFRDSIDKIAKSGIKTIIQPGGSKRDLF